MPYEYKTEHRVDFVDTDMAGLMHFSNFFRFMEATEHAFFRSLGQRLHTNIEGRMEGWARVHASCDYLVPLHYEDMVEVHLMVREMGAHFLTYDFIFRVRGQTTARGALKVVCVARDPNEDSIHPIAMPAEIAQVVQVAPLELLQAETA